jgi:hypothetical protein
MATFGYTGSGTGWMDLTDEIVGTPFTLTEAGSVTSMSVNLQNILENDIEFKCAIYAWVKDEMNDLMGQTQTGLCSWTGTWTVNFASPLALPAGDYVLVAWGIGTSGALSIAQHTESGFYRCYTSLTYAANFPDPNGFAYQADRECSIYATYTPSGAAAVPLGTLPMMGMGR